MQHKPKGRTECGKYCGISLVTHASKIILQVIAGRLGDCCERVFFSWGNSVSLDPGARRFDMMFISRRLQELARRKDTPTCRFALSTSQKRMTPSTESFYWLSLLVLACHGEYSPSSANSTTACKHACGYMMEGARISST